MPAAPASAPLAPAVSKEMSTPPPRPAETSEPAPSDLDSLLKPDFKPAARVEPAAEPEVAFKSDAKDAKDAAKPSKTLKDEEFDKFLAGTETKPKEEPAKSPEKAQEDVGEFKTPKSLREAYESTKAEKKQLAADIELLRKSQSDSKALLKEIEDLKKHNSEMEDTFRAHKYESSHEYKEKFMAPMERLYNNAVSTLSELEVADPDKGMRMATPADLETLVRLPTGKAISVAKELFGDAAHIVMSYREQIKTLYQQTNEAKETYKTRWQEIEQKNKADSLAQQEEVETLWKKANDELTEKYAEVFGDTEGDEEGNKLISTGRKLADLALRGDASIPMEQRVKVAAEIRNRAAAFGREVARRRKAEAQLTELKEKLKGYEDSAPNKGATKQSKSKEDSQPNSMSEALEALGALA